MKLILTALICTIIFSHMRAQQNTIDSLKNLLANAKHVTTRAKLLLQLAKSTTKPDSIIVYSKEAFQLSKSINYGEGELSALGLITFACLEVGDYSTALDKAFEELDRAEELKNKIYIGKSYNDIAHVYDAQGDWERNNQYLYKKKELAKEINDEEQINISLINIGNSYLNQHVLDSARIYISQALELAIRRNDSTKMGACYLNFGMIYTEMNVYDLAKNYLSTSLPYFKKNDDRFISFTQVALAAVFDSIGRFDSSFFYARESYRHALLTGSPDNIFSPAKQLCSLFRKTHQSDSALYYQDIVMQIKDSLTNMDKQKRVQNITFQQELKQMQKEKERQQQVDDRKKNLQTAGVAVFIPLFFGFVLLLSRRQIKPRTVEFIGILFLLFVFEFITLFFHPFIASWTHDSPIWMLLILVAIAFILVPLHHRSEDWIKKQLALQRTKELQKRVRMGEEAQRRLRQ